MNADNELHNISNGDNTSADGPQEKNHVTREEFRRAALKNIDENIKKSSEPAPDGAEDADTPQESADPAEPDTAETGGIDNAEDDGADDFDVEFFDDISDEGDDGKDLNNKGKTKKSNKKTSAKKSKPAVKSRAGKKSAAAKTSGAKRKKKKLTREQLRRKVRIQKILSWCALAAIVAIAAVLGYGFATIPENVIGRNVYIEGINVSGMTADEAKEALSDKRLLENRTITITCSGQTYSINGEEVGLSPRIDDTVDKAMRYGKSGNILFDGIKNTLQMFKRHTVVPNASITEDILRADLAVFGREIYGERTEHQLEIGDGVVICTPGHTGFDENTDTAYNEILTALDKERFSSIPVTLKSGPPQDLTVETLDAFTYADPVNAHYEYGDGTVYVASETNGRYLNLDEAAQLVPTVREGGDVVYIPYLVSYPEVTAEMLEAKLFETEIASYSTNYGSSNANRCANIANAASKIDGVILAPGDVFSFNDTVGPRSTANGFYTAKEYLNGQTVDGIGGGTCQVSSTLYNAVLYADLSIISRTNHMFTVGYCPDGQDATVSDTGIDFKFMNSMDYPIKISAVTSGYTITVSIIGTERDDPRTVQITNSTTTVGKDKSVHSVRYVYNSVGELIQTDDLGNSYYMAH